MRFRDLRFKCRFGRSLALVVLTSFALSVPAMGQMSFEQAPINYKQAPVNDPVSRLQKKLDSGEAILTYDPHFGYLTSLLEHLDVPVSAQALVFSKTSFQLRRISPRSPRAVYFGDNVYLGWVQGGDVMELSAVDPNLGANFYTLSQRESPEPKFVRHTDTCLQCHGSSLTRGVPGHLVRSVYTDPDGQLILSAGTFLTDHCSPLEQRWGGWYVTGRHGSQRHLGNLLVQESDDPQHMDTDKGANITDLAGRFETSSYSTPHSDIVALMVLEHQTGMHNLITQANFLTRLALRDQKIMNEMLERPDDYCSDSTKRRIRNAGEPVVKYMLFGGEIKLTDPIQGTSAFAQEFASRGPRDSQGRSLRELDLKSRLFKYPCSYLIYSEAFDALPGPAKDHIYQRLCEVLTGQDKSDDFAHLSSEDRTAIHEILRDTKRGLPDYWN
jgi:hypothetical protein